MSLNAQVTISLLACGPDGSQRVVGNTIFIMVARYVHVEELLHKVVLLILNHIGGSTAGIDCQGILQPFLHSYWTQKR
jgi:hypothetical protein